MPRNKRNSFDIKIMETIAANIDKYSKMRGYSQAKLSDLTGIKQATLSGYCTATSKPGCDKLQLIAMALGVTKADIDPIRFGDGVANNETVYQDVRIQKIFGNLNSLSKEDRNAVVALFEDFCKLNATGKEKGLSQIRDLTKISDYTEILEKEKTPSASY